MRNHLYKISPVLILLSVAILAYWQASFMIWTFKWDMLDVVLPWRYFVGECLQNGVFPFWNPFQQTGYPIHADLQCPVWYPETWIIGSISGYNIFILHILFVLNIFIAGFGMYKLAFYFNKRKTESLIVGISYMLCGFFVAHGQHFFALIGAAYIPLVIYFYLKMLDSPGPANLCKLSIFTFLQISGGYQALTIISAYLLFTLFIFYIIKNFNNRKKIVSIIKYQLYFALVIILLCSPIIISVIQISEYTSRFREGITLMQAMKYPFTPQSGISVLFPFSTTANSNFFRTDISMSNIYFGLFGIVFFILAFLRKKKNIEWVFLIFGFFSLLASFGDYLPVRKFLADFFPLMNQFRMPSYFTIFFIVAALVSVSIHLPDMITDIKSSKKKLLLITGITLFIILFLNLIFYIKTGSDFFKLLRTRDFFKIATELTLFDRIFIQSLFHVSILLIFTVTIKAIRNELRFKRILLILVFFDLFISINLNSYFSCFENYSPYGLHDDISKHPKGFIIPQYEKISETTDASMSEWPLWRNMGNFQKRITFNAFTSLLFDNYIFLMDEQPVLKDSLLSNYFVYLSDRIFTFDSISQQHKFSSKDIFLKNDDYKKLASIPLQLSEDDTIIVKKFNPNRIELVIENKHHAILTLLQQHYKGWQLFVDGKQTDIYRSNSLFMSSVLEPGKHRVEFRYSNNLIVISSIITFLILSLILLYLIHFNYSTGNKNYIIISFVFLLLILAVFLFILRSVSGNNLEKRQKKFNLKIDELAQTYSNDSIIIALNTDLKSDSLFRSHHVENFRFKVPPDFNDFRRFVSNRSEPVFIYGVFNAFNPPEIEYYIKDHYPCVEKELKFRESKILVYSKRDECKEKTSFLKIENGFETSSDLWNANPVNLDSSIVYSGKYSYRLDSIAIYSPTFQSSFNDLAIDKPEQYIIDISVFVYNSEGAQPFIVFDSHSYLKRDIWKGYNIRKHNNMNNQWIKVHATINLTKSYNKKDSFKIYIWNNGKPEFYIDKMEIRFDKKQ